MHWASLPAPFALVAHDAGAANLLLGWLDAYPLEAFRPCLEGPARRLFDHRFPKLQVLGLDEALAGVTWLLSGTSGPGVGLEHEARLRARARGLPSIAVLDHWVNYPQRFFREGLCCLPDELWVADAQALALARTCFPTTTVCEQPNLYLEGLRREVSLRQMPAGGLTPVLYVLEPMRSDWGHPERGPGEIQALDYFLSRWDRLGLCRDQVELRLRPHPSEDPQRYHPWIFRRRAEGLRVALDPFGDLVDSLAWASWVAGCESYALVAALACSRRAVSTLPPWAPLCRLPHAELLLLRALPS